MLQVLDHVIHFLVKRPYLDLGLEVVHVIVLRPYPVLRLLAILAHHDHRSLDGQETKDRVRSKNDYMVNLKAEIEIRTLHEKVDHMIQDLQHEIFEMQQVQTKLLEEIRKKVTNDE